MRFKWNNKYFKWGATAFIVLAAALVFYMAMKEADGISGAIGSFLGAFSAVFTGFVLAYILNPLIRLLEKPFKKLGLKLFKGNEEKASSFARAFALALTALILIVFIVLLMWLVIPRVYESITTIASNLSGYYANIKSFLGGVLDAESAIGRIVLSTLDSLGETVSRWFTEGFIAELAQYLQSAISGIYGVVMTIFDVIIGLIIAIYVLADKDKLAAQGKKLCYSFLRTERATKFLKALKRIDRIFTGFISARLIDSVVLGFVCYFIMLIFGMPYRELISVLIGVTNIIPIFGPFIGMIPSAVLILMVSPVKCLIFIIALVIIMQIDSNLIFPKIAGNATGLSGFWVLCSMMIFGGLFGFWGMVVGVPTFAVIYAYIKERMNLRLKEKNITSSTEDFKKISYIDPETNEPVGKEDQ
ncbi:MAG: AI-2E family transporter [Lachnospiraceae bacterium]|nr:AI-2E family transporter [Lachnospiraceae bacterium]